jgi:hypothetical protein
MVMMNDLVGAMLNMALIFPFTWEWNIIPTDELTHSMIFQRAIGHPPDQKKGRKVHQKTR